VFEFGKDWRAAVGTATTPRNKQAEVHQHIIEARHHLQHMQSTYDGERVACVAAIERLLKSEGLDFNDLAEWFATTGSAMTATFCRPTRVRVPKHLLHALHDLLDQPLATEREREIACGLLDHADRRAGLTEKQIAFAESIIKTVAKRAEAEVA
jgi:hypothetical protein